jgi:hypothetical protein
LSVTKEQQFAGKCAQKRRDLTTVNFFLISFSECVPVATLKAAIKNLIFYANSSV